MESYVPRSFPVPAGFDFPESAQGPKTLDELNLKIEVLCHAYSRNSGIQKGSVYATTWLYLQGKEHGRQLKTASEKLKTASEKLELGKVISGRVEKKKRELPAETGLARAFRFKIEEPVAWNDMIERIKLDLPEKGTDSCVIKTPEGKGSASGKGRASIAISKKKLKKGSPHGDKQKMFYRYLALCADTLQSPPSEADDASHLCHNGQCINPRHLNVENVALHRKRPQCAAKGECVCGNEVKCIF
jgi:hypothetical protein